MSRFHIALAHRDRVLAKSVHRAIMQTTNLEWVGYAATESEVLQLCAAHSPELLLLDIHLDDAPALSVIRALRVMERPPKIVGFANSSDPAIIRPLLRSGSSGYLLTTEPLRETFEVLPLVLSNKIVLSSSLISALPE